VSPFPFKRGRGKSFLRGVKSLLNSLFPNFKRKGESFLKRGRRPSYTPFAAASKKKGECE
jgi:hypothetical protein